MIDGRNQLLPRGVESQFQRRAQFYVSSFIRECFCRCCLCAGEDGCLHVVLILANTHQGRSCFGILPVHRCTASFLFFYQHWHALRVFFVFFLMCKTHVLCVCVFLVFCCCSFNQITRICALLQCIHTHSVTLLFHVCHNSLFSCKTHIHQLQLHVFPNRTVHYSFKLMCVSCFVIVFV